MSCVVHTHSSEECQGFCGDRRAPTQVLCDDVFRNVIRPNCAKLRTADPRCHLDELLFAMLKHAPHPLGQRYVAICLLTAHQKGEDGVVEAAKAWLDNFFLPMVVISKAIKKEPIRGNFLDPDATMEDVESTDEDERRTYITSVARREKYHCAITNVFDRDLAMKLIKEKRYEEIPSVGQHRMAAAHIIPFLLNHVDVTTTRPPGLINARTWEMFRSWTQIDSMTLLGSDINSPANSIYMTTQEHLAFGNFDFYFDKEAFPDNPNKYKVRVSQPGIHFFSNGSSGVDVEFPTLEESSIEPPNPYYLKVHAAFAKVLFLCEAVQYVDNVELDAEMDGTLQPNGEMDYASKLWSKLAIIA